MGRHVPPKRPYQFEPKHCYNTEDSNQNLSGLVNTGKKKDKAREYKTITLHSSCPDFIQYRQEEHCSAPIQTH